MKNIFPTKTKKGFTLIEITLVLGLILTISGVIMFLAGSKYGEIANAQKAEALMSQIDNARSAYLIKNPTLSYSNLTIQAISEYLMNPDAFTHLRELGYTVTNDDVTNHVLSYSLDSDRAMPLKSFNNRSGR